eukprot:scaffold50136_cov26-Tisochrysis_lutea.AAC.1
MKCYMTLQSARSVTYSAMRQSLLKMCSHTFVTRKMHLQGLAWDSSGDLSGSISASDVGSALEQRISEVVGGLPEGGFLNKKQRVHK